MLSRLYLVLLTLLVAAVASNPAIARADALTEFTEAETAYREQRYAVATQILESLIATTATVDVDPTVLLESRKYLAAAYLFLGRASDADRQFELLLGQDPEYHLDPVVFPREVVQRFEGVRTHFAEARAAQRDAALADTEARLAEERSRLDLERLRYLELWQIANGSSVHRENSRIIALLPFGIGQFQNRRRRLARFFVAAESVTLALYVGSYVWNRSLTGREVAPQDELRWRNSLSATRIVNWTSGAMFATLAITGAVEAEVNFVPSHETSVPRSLPEHLRPPDRPIVRLGVSPVALQLRVDF